MNIDPNDEHKLVIWLARSLQDATVDAYGVYLNLEDDLPELSDATKRSFEKGFDRGGLPQFASYELNRWLHDDSIERTDVEVTLRTVPIYDDPIGLSQRIIERIKQPARQYFLFVRGPAAFQKPLSNKTYDIAISKRLSLVDSETILSHYDFRTSDTDIDQNVWRSSAIRREFRTPVKNYPYFKFAFSGISCDRFSSKAAQELQDELRAFYGACLAHEILYSYPYRTSDSKQPLILFIDRKTKCLENVNSLDSDLFSSTYFIANPRAIKAFRSTDKLVSATKPALDLFNCSNKDRLKTAAVWILRAQLSFRPMDRLLESAIALEVLLGDRKMADKVGLTRLMANRCAYALAATEEERHKLILFFESFYALRSEVVHSGKLNPSNTELELVSQATDLAARMLTFEQRLSCASDLSL